MLGLGVDLHRFHVLGGVKRRDVVFRRIDQTRLQAGVHLAVRHRCGVGAHGADQGHPQVRLLHANFQTLGIGHAADGFFGVDGTRAAVIKSQADVTHRLAALENFSAHRTVQRVTHVIDRMEQERHGGHHGHGANAVHRCHVDTHQIQGADLHLVDGFFLRAQSAFVEDLDLVFATGQFLQHGAHVLDRHHGGVIVGVVDVGRAEFHRVGRERKRGSDGQQRGFKFHGCLLLRVFKVRRENYCAPKDLIKASSCSISAGFKSVNGGRTGPAV